MELVSLPLLLRLRLEDARALAGLATLDVLLVERLARTEGLDRLPPAALVGVLAVDEPAASLPVALAARLVGPAARSGSERALVLELVARTAGAPDALRWLQLRAPGETGEVLASPSVAAELEAAGARVVGGPAPPVFGRARELLTRV